MRIGLAIYNFDPRKGGAERYAFDLATRLVKRGHEVVVFCGRGIEVPGINLVHLDPIPYPRWLRNLTFALMHRRALGKAGIDVMLGFGNVLEADVYQSHGGVQRIWMEREIASYDSPVERSIKGLALRTSLNQRIQEWIAEYPVRQGRCARIVAISPMVKEHMKTHFGLGEEAFSVVFNGVDTERFRPGDKGPGGPLKILFSAGNFRLKGLLPLLRALGEVRKRGIPFHLTVMGRGRRDRYLAVIRELGLTDRVTFLGETGAPQEVYRGADVLAHPTYYDACSLTTMEAMASGIPTITTRWNGASALVSPGEGYVIEGPEDIAGLADALTALADRGAREAMGTRARIKMEAYTMDKNALEMERICYEVAHGTGRT